MCQIRLPLLGNSQHSQTVPYAVSLNTLSPHMSSKSQLIV